MRLKESRFDITQMMRLLKLVLLAAAVGWCAPRLARAVISVDYTPADLVRSSGQVVLLKLSWPGDGAGSARVVETIKGEPLPYPTVQIELSDDVGEEEVTALLDSEKTAPALLFTAKRAGGEAVEVVEIGTRWFNLRRAPKKWRLSPNGGAMAATWAGDAARLAAAARAVAADPTLTFPVRADAAWGGALHLGKLPGKPAGCVVADFGAATGLCAIVLGGPASADRVYAAGAKGQKPSDVSDRLKLGTSSRLAAPADVDGDGRIDWVSWDGKALHVALQSPDGTFALRSPAAAIAQPLHDLLSLDAIDVDGRAAVLAGTSAGPVVLAFAKDGGVSIKPLSRPAEAKAATGGRCVVADFNRDGRADVMQLAGDGLLLWRRDASGGFAAPESVLPGPLPEDPRLLALGDYDGDGRLDMIVGGKGGAALLAQVADGRWQDLTASSGELNYHGNNNGPDVIGGAPADLNRDGRQGVALFYTARKPMLFFNRGFAVFGLARALDLTGAGAGDGEAPGGADAAGEQKQSAALLQAAAALQRGQAAGAMLDLDGDGVQDLLATTDAGDVWALFCTAAGKQASPLTIALPPGTAGPITVSVADARRALGLYVVRAGMPVTFSYPEKVPLTVSWTGNDGKPQRQEVGLTCPTRIELKPTGGRS